MWIIAIAIIILLLLIPRSEKQVYVDNFQTSNFEISPASRKMFLKMQVDGISKENLKKFAMMEDRFLEYEKDAACRGIDRQIEAGNLDQHIREMFTQYDFTFHNKHMKQMAEQNRIINPYLSCLRA